MWPAEDTGDRTRPNHLLHEPEGLPVEHVVFFPAQDGTPAFRRVAALEDAVRLVEHLRNVEGVNEVSVHALTEVPLAFRTVFKVELPACFDPAADPATQPAGPPAGEASAQSGTAPEPRAEAEPVPEPVPEPVAVMEAVPSVQPDLHVATLLEVVPDLQPDAVPEPAEPAYASSNGASSNGHSDQGAKSLGFFA